MIERIVPQKKSKNDTLETGVPEQGESSERLEKNVREQYDLRLRFAEAISEKKGIPLEEAMRDYTDLHARLTGKAPSRTEGSSPVWEEFIVEFPSISDHEARLDAITNFSKRIDTGRSREDYVFWPFYYQYSEKDHSIRIHFGTMNAQAGDPDTPSILSSERLDEMRQKLKAMFTHIKETVPDPDGTLTVRGVSWLYNREAYRRFYPASYTAHPEIRRGNFVGGGTWGQFRNKTGAVNEAERERFLQNLKKLDPEHPEEVFPYKTLMVRAPIVDFYKEYGID